MILVIDVHYEGNKAFAAGVLFKDGASAHAVKTYVVEVSDIKPYEPGAFYKRELPCILKLLESIDENLDLIIIDGFVHLGESKRDGLGMHLYSALKQSTPVIGVAKKAFAGTPEEFEIYRGNSKKPLWVTSVGIDLQDSKSLIKTMHGEHRIPTLLRRVDQFCRRARF